MTQFNSLSSITAFVATAQTGSFTEAASRLGVTKSAVGKSVTRLEEHLGINLLLRTTRRLTLTSEGEYYLQQCQIALSILEQANNQVQENQSVLTGKIRLDLPSAFGRKCIMPVLMTLMDKQPQLKMSISFSERYIDMHEESVDLVVRIGHLPDSSNVVARQLTTQKLVLCASPIYLQKHGIPKEIEALSDHRCIVGFRQEAPFYWMLKEADTFRQYIPTPFYELADGDAMLDAVSHGYGIAQLPLWMIGDLLKGGQLQRILIKTEGYQSPINMMWHKGQKVPPKTRYIADALLQVAKEGGFDE
ncbi:LysR family transcriptional regulator [Proteus sp. G2669]|uniref:LysR family transcriptional regulator n=1 Tax=Proteus sp. G2669 TaxID=2698881 RepID=UPI001412DB85|nr:LysR family transcriptional regulator [Proteus sp. G2669]NBM55331.1 LysR family transcriptional regulator [Proteus sp. G2669]